MAAPLPDLGGIVLCLHRPDQRQLAGAVAGSLHPATVLPLDPDVTAGLGDLAARVTGWIDLCALGGARADEHDAGPWTRRLAILQQVLSARPPALRAMQVTQGMLDAPGTAPAVSGARLAGFVRSLGAEYPWARGDVVDTDLPAEQTAALARQLAAAWRTPAPEGETCLRAGVRYAPRLAGWAPSSRASWQADPTAFTSSPEAPAASAR